MIINRNEQFDDSELREAYETGFIREREPGFERAEEPGEFNPNGPGVFGYNGCARCGTHVDINGVDRDNRKHFEADGGCAGFAQAELAEIRASLSTIKNEKTRQYLKKALLEPALAQIEQDVSSALRQKAVDAQVAVAKAKEFVEAVSQGKADLATKNEFIQTVQTDVIAQAKKTVNAIFRDATELYYRLALDLRFIAINEPKLIEAKRRVDSYSERLGKLRKEYADKLLQIEAPINEAEGLAPGFYGSDPTDFLDFPGWTEKTPSLEEQIRAIKERVAQKIIF